MEVCDGIVCIHGASSLPGRMRNGPRPGEAETHGREESYPLFFCPIKPDKSKWRKGEESAGTCSREMGRYKAYNIRAVETEMQIRERLSGFPVPEAVWVN